MIIQTKGRETAKLKEQFKQKAGRKKAVQRIGRMLMYKRQSKQKAGSLRAVQNKRQDADVQNQSNADNTPEPSVTSKSMVMGKNNKENNFLSGPINDDNKSLFSELTINDNQSFLSEQFIEDDMKVNVEKTNQKNNNNSDSLISDQSKDVGIDATAKTKEEEKKT